MELKVGEVIAIELQHKSWRILLRKVRAPIWPGLLGNSQCGWPWG